MSIDKRVLFDKKGAEEEQECSFTFSPFYAASLCLAHVYASSYSLILGSQFVVLVQKHLILY